MGLQMMPTNDAHKWCPQMMPTNDATNRYFVLKFWTCFREAYGDTDKYQWNVILHKEKRTYKFNCCEPRFMSPVAIVKSLALLYKGATYVIHFRIRHNLNNIDSLPFLINSLSIAPLMISHSNVVCHKSRSCVQIPEIVLHFLFFISNCILNN